MKWHLKLVVLGLLLGSIARYVGMQTPKKDVMGPTTITLGPSSPSPSQTKGPSTATVEPAAPSTSLPPASSSSIASQSPAPQVDLPEVFLPLLEAEEDRQLRGRYDAAEKKDMGSAGGKGRQSALFALFMDPNVPLEAWRFPTGRATPIVCDGMEYYSGHFSIPAQNLLTEEKPSASTIASDSNATSSRGGTQKETATTPSHFAPKQPFEVVLNAKTKDWSTVIPGRKETYIFKEELVYQGDMEKSLFGITRRRFGFATNRNLELLAAGVIPYFCGGHKIPQTGTLASLPKRLLRFVGRGGIPGVTAKCDPIKKAVGNSVQFSTYNLTEHKILARKLYAHTRQFQVSTYHALYFLSATSLTRIPKNVLVLWSSHYSIMLTSFLHGLSELGVVVEDVPRRPEIYASPMCRQQNEDAKGTSYARGWFFMCRIQESPNITRQDIEARIRQRDFDLIVVSITDTLTYKMTNASKEVPHWDAIRGAYQRREILIMNDADLIKPMKADVAHRQLHDKGIYFKRETHGCTESIW